MSFLTDILQQYVGGSASGASASGDQAADHYAQVAAAAPPGALSSGLSAAFNSDQTPPLGDMVGQLFGQSNAQQQAGVLNQILASAGPALLATLAGGALGRFINPAGSASAPGPAAQITPEQASQLSPDQVKEIVEHAQRHDPGITDKLSSFYAQHTGLVKTLGGAALAIALAKVADHMRS